MLTRAYARLLLWFCRVALRIAAENWERIFWKPISPGMFAEIRDLGKSLDEALWTDGKVPTNYLEGEGLKHHQEPPSGAQG